METIFKLSQRNDKLMTEPTSDTFRILRYKTRIDESNAMKEMKSDWQKDIEAFYEKMKEDERERVYKAIRKVWGDGFRWDLSGEDLIQSVIIQLKKGI